MLDRAQIRVDLLLKLINWKFLREMFVPSLVLHNIHMAHD